MPSKPPKAKIVISTTLDQEEGSLLERAFRALVWSEQDNIVQFAREHIYVPDGNGGAKKFEGNYQNLVDFFNSQPQHGRPHGMDTFDRLKERVEALQKKLLPPNDLNKSTKK